RRPEAEPELISLELIKPFRYHLALLAQHVEGFRGLRPVEAITIRLRAMAREDDMHRVPFEEEPGAFGVFRPLLLGFDRRHFPDALEQLRVRLLARGPGLGGQRGRGEPPSRGEDGRGNQCQSAEGATASGGLHGSTPDARPVRTEPARATRRASGAEHDCAVRPADIGPAGRPARMRRMAESIAGVVERVTFHNPETGFAVLRVQAAGRRGQVTVVGTLPSVVAGEYVEATGTWVQDRDHGLQFQAEQLRTTPPHTVAGIEKYLGSGLVKGIGPHFARKIVEVFGERTLTVIDESPTFLREVKGIGPRRIQQIRASWQQQKAVRAIMLFLQSHGVGTA